MNENVKYNEKCIKGNTAYYKIKINDIINYEINKFGVDAALYQGFNDKISESFSKFTDKLISGADFDSAITTLRDKVIEDCIEVEDKSPDKMRTFFKEYIFDKVYTMDLNIKKGILPDDYEQELEAAKLKMEEEEKLKAEEDRVKQEENITITVKDETEERQPDLIDLMWSYFLGESKSSSSKTNKTDNEKESKEKKEDKEKDKIKFD